MRHLLLPLALSVSVALANICGNPSVTSREGGAAGSAEGGSGGHGSGGSGSSGAGGSGSVAGGGSHGSSGGGYGGNGGTSGSSASGGFRQTGGSSSYTYGQSQQSSWSSGGGGGAGVVGSTRNNGNEPNSAPASAGIGGSGFPRPLPGGSNEGFGGSGGAKPGFQPGKPGSSGGAPGSRVFTGDRNHLMSIVRRFLENRLMRSVQEAMEQLDCFFTVEETHELIVFNDEWLMFRDDGFPPEKLPQRHFPREYINAIRECIPEDEWPEHFVSDEERRRKLGGPSVDDNGATATSGHIIAVVSSLLLFRLL